MSPENANNALADLSREEMLSALFANLVFQSTNMALMFLGRVPHPESGEKTVDTEAARVFIDQLEMLKVKTQGNLTNEEQRLLQQSLTHLRVAFVETVGTAPVSKEETASASDAAGANPGSSDELESQKRFTKKS